MWIVIKEKFVRTGPLVLGGRNSGTTQLVFDRKVDSLDDVESGEIFIKCNTKK